MDSTPQMPGQLPPEAIQYALQVRPLDFSSSSAPTPSSLIHLPQLYHTTPATLCSCRLQLLPDPVLCTCRPAQFFNAVREGDIDTLRAPLEAGLPANLTNEVRRVPPRPTQSANSCAD